MNEPHSIPDALDRRIDEALRRRFEPPPGLETLAARTLQRCEQGRRGAHRGPWIALVGAAAAALAAAFLWSGERAPREHVERAAPLAAELPFCRLIGPLLDRLPEPGRVHSPDLARLYRDMDACQRESSAAACGEGDFLAERMSATYGQPLALRPGAAGLLHGPFGSDEWPTGTIVTGTSDDLTAVLVVDRDDTLACCIRMDLPEDSGLRLFTWQVGDVVLTEITPLDEPRLLPYIE